jgi:hypothetical protein
MNTNERAERETGGLLAFIWPLATQRDRRNKVAHIRWSLLLAASVVGSAVMLRTGLASNVALKSAIIALPLALMVPWLRAFLRFLREADELVRRIHIEGAAAGFWAGFAFGTGYVVLTAAGLPQPRPPIAIALMVAVMGLAYYAGRIFASKRYR